MRKLKVAILGAGRIGKYHAREFAGLGAKVTAILGSTKESSLRTAEKLEEEFNIHVNPYPLLKELLANENLDIVSICTPPEMHQSQIIKCLERGLHVMCEKPLVQDSGNNYETARNLFGLAEERKRLLTVNTQWASIADYLRGYEDFSNLRTFSVYMEPDKEGVNMLPDHLPHANSVLIKLIPNGKAREIEFLPITDDSIKVRFLYENQKITCKVDYDFKPRVKNPGQIVFSLNGRQFKREIGPGYKQVFVSDEIRFGIEDPLRVSIDKFLGTLKGSNTLLVNKKEILENIFLAEQIISEYASQNIKAYKAK
jgi:hypothetical protein